MADWKSRSRNGQLPWWFGIPFFLGGLAFAAFGVVLLGDELRYGREGVAIQGEVVDTIYSPGGGDDGPSYAIRYAFTDPATGQRHGGQTDVGEAEFDAAVIGDPIEVTYLPAEPTKSRLGSPEPQLLLPLLVLGGGGLFAVVGVGLSILVWRIRKHGAPSWVHVATGFSEAEEDPAAAMREIFAGLGIASAAAVPGPPAAAAAAASASGTAEPMPSPAGPAGPLTADDLRAIDARLAPPPATGPPPPTGPPTDDLGR